MGVVADDHAPQFGVPIFAAVHAVLMVIAEGRPSGRGRHAAAGRTMFPSTTVQPSLPSWSVIRHLRLLQIPSLPGGNSIATLMWPTSAPVGKRTEHRAESTATVVASAKHASASKQPAPTGMPAFRAPPRPHPRRPASR